MVRTAAPAPPRATPSLAPRTRPLPADTAGATVQALGLATLVALGLIVRLWVWGASDELNADEALPGLMARHIAAGEELPVFFYGQHYFGAVEAYLIAALFSVFGFRPWLAIVPPLVASLALIPITFALAHHLAGRPAAWLAALPVAFPPPMLARLYTNSGGGFSLAFALHGVALLCYLRAFLPPPPPRAAASPRSPMASMAWGAAFSLISGLLCWIWQPALALYPVLLALLWWRRPSLRHSWRFALVVAPVLVGLAPPLLYNLYHGWPSATQLVRKYGAVPGTEAAPGIGSGSQALGSLLLIAFGGGNEAEGGVNPLQGALVATAFPLTLLLLRAAPQWRPDRWRAAWLLALVAAVDAIAAHGTVRHLAPVAHLGFAFAGAAVALLAGRLPAPRLVRYAGAALTGLVVFVVPNVWLDAHAAGLFQRFVAGRGDVRAAVAALDARGLTTGYADYWTAYPVAYFSAERIALDPSVATIWGERVDRYPAGTGRVHSVGDLSRLFLLLDDRCSPLPYLLPLEQEEAAYRLEHVARWYLLWDIRPPPDATDRTMVKWYRVIISRAHC
ncbi:MAG: hypothetical protein M3442_14120 [Chloroflexota bacterium]|nr:hypothetical protein [Chloroflexota bacterium]